ncbi:MAG: hypothetical protein QW432_05905 [Desulfurococcaceae archaeon]
MKNKYHEVVSDEYTAGIAFLCRVINFLEDVLEDAECDDIYVNSVALNARTVVLHAVRCKYDVFESIEVFQDRYRVNVKEGIGDLPLRELYEHVIDYYKKTLHRRMKQYAWKTHISGVEYYLGVLFNGKGFLIEGEKNKVILPGTPQCFSAHTHPLDPPVPSKNDVKAVNRILVDRGIGHVIEAVRSSLAIYRVRPLSLRDYETLKSLEKKGSFVEMIARTGDGAAIRARYIH